MKKYLLPFTFLCCTGLTAMAQEAMPGEELEDVIVLSDKLQIPFKKQNRNIQVLTAEQIAQIPAKSVNDLLAYIAGVDVRQKGPNGSQADIGIDGGTFDQTLVLINGFKASDPQTGHNMMNIPIPIDAIERIEVIKGAAARIYGVNALMGAINIVTKKDRGNTFSARLYSGSSFRNDDTTGNLYGNFGAQVVGQMSTGNWQHLVGASWDQGNGYRYNTAYKNTRVLYTGKGQLSKKVGLELLGGVANSDFGANAFYAAPGDKNATEQVNASYLAFRAPVQISNVWTLRPSLNYRNGYDHYVYIKQRPEVSQNKHRTHTIDASLDNTFTTGYGNIVVGLNVRSEQINSTNLKDHSRLNYGAFLEYQYQWKEKLDVNLGAYVNQNTDYGFNVYPGIDVGYQINNNLRAFANAGYGQRLPTFTDLYYKGPGNQGNEFLNPEYMIGYEAGLKYRKNEFYANASFFLKNGRDFIDWVRADSTSPWMAQNFTSLNNKGVHFDAGYGKTFGAVLLNIYGGYTYLNPEIGSITDASKQDWMSQYAVNALEHQAILRLNATILKQFNIGINNRYQQRLNAGNPLNGYSRKSYVLTDIRIGYQVKRFQVDADVNNLFDIKYIESGVVPLPGRWYTLSLIYKLK
ncbi:MAG: hypothetical protein BGO31_18155 [Bacteroidetes bacterium 43-16]|nr:MAG: hypothetical protein BGO31_18155 [Bacteroidetes bacterium 43-16]